MRTLLSVLIILTGAAHAGEEAPEPEKSAPHLSYFEPFIGEWRGAPREFGGRMISGGSTFSWRGKNAFVLWQAALERDGERIPSFDAQIMWDPIEGRAEYMFPLGQASGFAIQESGYFTPTPKGMIRHVEVRYGAGVPLPPDGKKIAPDGGYARIYLQTFETVDDNTFRTKVMFLNEDGEWRSNLVGDDGDWIIMRRAN